MLLAQVVQNGDGQFYGPPWHHYFGDVSAMLGLLIVPLLLGLLAIALSVGHRVSRAVQRRHRSALAFARSLRATPAQPLLASDAEREAAAGVVSHAVGEARLTLDEGSQRIDEIWQARHRHEIARQVADLPPAPKPATPRAARPRLAPALVLALAALAVQLFFGLWELWPVAVVATSAVALLRRR